MKRIVFFFTALFFALQISAQTITVTSPNGGEIWAGCSVQNITWTASGTSQYYNIDYSVNNGASWIFLASNFFQAGPNCTFSWTVPNLGSTTALVRVYDQSNNLIIDQSNALFTITAALTVTSPNGGESWQVANPATRNITWTFAAGSSNYFNIDYSTNAGASWTSITTYYYQGGSTGSYTWTIPNTPSTQTLVRVTDSYNSCKSDNSDNLFTIVAPAPVITVVSPNGGNIYYVNGSYNITWTYQYVAGSFVEVDYSTNNGTSWNVITASTSISAGVYTWTPVPNTPSNQCLVRVRSTADTTISDVSNAVFSIVYPYVTVTSPNGSESWNGCTTQTINWNYFGYTAQNWKVEYSTNNGTSWNTIVASTGSTSYSWLIPNGVTYSQCLVRVTSTTDALITDVSNANFTINNVAYIIVTSPNGGESWQVNNPVTRNITWSFNGSTSDYFTIEYSTNGGTIWNTLTTYYYQGTGNGTYTWTIPNSPSANCMVRISDSYNPCISDTSNAHFTIVAPAPVITVVSPNGGNIYYVNGSYNITWTYQYVAGSFVEVDYSTNNGTSWNVITASTSISAGVYTWTPVPNTPSNQCLVRVRSTADTTISDVSNAVFSIVYPYVTVTSPNGSESWNGCTTQTINWNYFGYTAQNWKVEYSTNNGTSWNTIVASTGSTSYSWLIPNGVTYSQCLVRVTSTTDALITDVSNANFTINNVAYIIVTSPNGGESWQVNNPVTRNITWSFNGSTSDYFTIEYSTNGGTIWNTLTTYYYQGTGNGTYTWTIPNSPSANCMVRISDSYNPCISDTSNAHFTIVAPAPVITVVSPNGGNIYYVNGSYNITWTYQYVAGSFVEVDYSTNNGTSWNVITASTSISAGVYTWTPVPNTPSNQCLVRVRSTADTTISDVSNAVFSIVYPYVTVTSPNGSESWNGCTTQTINWNYFGYTAQNWKVEYSTNNGTSWNTIVASTGSTSYSWLIPNGVTYSQCLVRVTSTTDALITDVSNANFTINNVAYIIVTSPNGGESWQVNNPVTRNITWSFNGSTSDYFTIEYSTNGGTIWNTLTTYYYQGTGNGTYTWTIPNSPSANCMVRISDSYNPCISDTSNAHFTIVAPAPVITVVSPNGGNIYYVNGSYNITWTYQYVAGSFVEVDYSTNNGTSWNVITASTSISAGVYTWTPVPNTPSNQCLVRVRSTADTTISDVSNAVFSIVYPYVTVTSPNGSESWNGCTTQTINWNYFGYTAQNWKVEYSTNNGTSWNTIVASTGSTSYSWLIPNGVTYSQCLVRVTSTTDALITDVSNANFTINNVAYIIVTSPNGGESWQVNNPVTRNITWSFNGSTSDYFTIEYSTNGGTIWNTLTTYYYQGTGNGTYTWTIPNSPSANCMVRISDSYNPCISDTSNAHFTIVAPAPVITVVSPNGGNIYYVNGSYNITWTYQYVAGSFVEVDYSTNNGTSWNVITASTSISAGVYTWTPVPNTPSNQCLVRVRSTADTTISDVSNAVFSIVYPYVTVTSPNGSESWNGCTTQTINWNYFGYTAQNWKVEYSTNNGTSWNTIVASTGSTSYSWLIPNGVTYSQCLVRVTSTTDALITDVSNANFTINNVAYIIVTSPNGGESWQVNNPVTRNITWSFNGSTSDYFTIEYSTNGGTIWNTLTTYYYQGTGNGTYTWTIPNSPSANCMVRISDSYNPCISDTSNAHFTIVAPIPYITVTYPSNTGITLYTSSAYNITWTSGYLSSSFVRIDYSIDSGANWILINSSASNTGSYSWTIPNTPSTKCYVRVTDYGNNATYDRSDNVFTIAPAITVTAPNGGENLGGCTVTTITWIAGGTSAYYTLDYSTNGGVTWTNIITNTYISGTNCTYNWTLPNTPSTYCLVRVTDYNSGVKTDQSNAVFTINPTIIVTNPSNGGSFAIGSQLNITWTALGVSNYYNIDYSTNGGGTWNNIVFNTYIATNNYLWTVPASASVNCLVRVTDYFANCKQDQSDIAFTIAASPPAITVTSPNGGENWIACSTHNITWSANGTSGIFVIEYSSDNGSTWSTLNAGYHSTNGVYSWSLPSAATVQGLIRVKDSVTTALVDVSNADFTISTLATPGAIAGTTPVCQGTTQTYTVGLVTGATSYTWSLPGGWSGTSTTNTITVSVGPNSGNISVVANSSCSSSSSSSLAITVNALPGTPGSITGVTAPCGGTVQVYSITAVAGATSYSWTLPSGWSGSSTTNAITATTGATNGQVQVTANNACGASGTSSLAVNIATTPNTPGAISGSATPCQSVSTSYSVTAVGGATSYTWTLPSGWTGTSTTNSITTTPSVNAGTITVTASNACGTSLASSLSVTPTAPVAPSVSIVASGTIICSGQNVTFTPAPVNGGAPTYQWYKNGVAVSVGATYSSTTLANNDSVWCVMTSTLACVTSTTATSNHIVISVTGTVAPAVSISANPGTSICVGTSVTFAATPANGGSGPVYQWKKNGGNVGAGGTTYTDAALNNGDIITCVLTSNLACASPSTATSNADTIQVNTNASASVTISANPGNTICAGANVTFTATPTNGGGTPSYQWKVNGANVGTGVTYSTTTLANGDTVTCVLTSSLACVTQATVQSAKITMTVNSTVTPTITISPSANNICAGTSVTFTAVVTNGGGAPAYQWKKNSVNVGVGSTYTSTTLANNDTITCVLTSNASCASPTTTNSNSVVMIVNPSVTPSVIITANPGNTICSGVSVTFNTTPTNGGGAPTYQWLKNGSNIGGATSSSYTSTTLANGDIITVQMTSNANCAVPTTVTSNPITMVVTTSLTPSVSISANPGNTICVGVSATFTASPTNGGGAPTYQWKVNGANVGTGVTYTSSSLGNGDIVTCILTSSLTCVTQPTATSNAITMIVNALVAPAITISASANNICAGTSVTFTAVLTNGGSAPIYQWKRNSANIGGGSTYTSTTLANNDTITCVLTSNANCVSPATATSNSVIMIVNPSVTPSVSIAANPGNNICSGQSVTFNAAAVNGGAAPTYQWLKNGSNIGGATSSTYTSTTLANNDVITVQMTSNAFCASPTTVSSNSITMSVVNSATPSVSITANPSSNICSGISVTFTASPTNGGGAPTYQWQVDGVNVGTGSTFTSTTLANGDFVTCILTSSLGCVTQSTATSNTITMTVNQSVTPTITISTGTTNICSSALVTFTANITNGGTTPHYQWYRNGVPRGSDAASYTDSLWNVGDAVYCVFISNANCATSTIITSNTINLNVSPSVAPIITISANPSGPICAGTSVMFTATIANGGASPTYTWFVDGSVVGSNSATYTSASLVTGNVVHCQLLSNAACPSVNPVISNNITMTAVGPFTPTVSITTNTGTNICNGQSVTFTAFGSHGGSTPTYQWYLNGTPVGLGGATYTNGALANGDVVYCIMTSSLTSCLTQPTATSNTLTMNVSGTVVPTITISASSLTICAGSTITFTATANGSGSTPHFQWKRNGFNVGGDSAIFISSALSNGDIIRCILTSSASCANPTTATSNSDTVNVTNNAVASITIVASASTICAGTSVTFTATPTNGGGNPVYDWKVNGISFGVNASTFATSVLNNNDIITCDMTSSLICVTPATATSNSITMTVNPVLVPTVTISTGNNTICEGSSITFNSSVTNEGFNPSLQWQVNGSNATTGTTFTTTFLNNGDVVTCIMTSNATCASPLQVASNTITVTVNATVVPSVSIAASQNNVCAGTSITFTATPTNGGAASAYQWKLNGSAIGGATSSSYNSTALNNGDVISVDMTSNAVCPVPASATSNTVTVTIISNSIASVSISSNATNICAGTSVTFTATATNGGLTPSYIWKVNGTIVGGNASIYSTASLNNGDIVTCDMSTSQACTSPATVTSNADTILVGAPVTPSVSITPDNNNICSGSNVTFTATPTNGGSTPTYQWLVNGINTGNTANPFVSANLNNNDNVTCIMTSNAGCVTQNTATSNSVTMVVAPVVTPTVSVSSNSGATICAGTSVTFTASATNGGTIPVYQWQINSSSVGINDSTYNTGTLANGDIVTCNFTSNATCASPSSVTSNSITMMVTALPATPTATANSPLCEGTGLQLNTDSVSGATYSWIGPNGFTSNLQNPVNPNPTVNDSGTYSVVITMNGCGSQPGSVNVVVNAKPPVPVISQNGDTLTSSSAIGNQWYLNSSTIAGATNQTYLVTQTGWYVVVITNTQNCSSSSDSLFVTPTSIPSISLDANVKLVPNPFATQFTISISGNTTELNNWAITITDDLGRMVYHNKNVQYHNNVDLENHASGVYFVNVMTGKERKTFRVIKQ